MTHKERAERREQMCREISEGASLVDTASKHGVSISYIKSLAQQAGVIKVRTKDGIAVLSAHMPGVPGVYRIRSIETGDSYIGASRNMKKRCASHELMILAGTHNNRLVRAAVEREGADAFVFEVLQHVTDEANLDRVEEKWCRRLNPTLNIQPTGMALLRKPRAA